MNPQKNKGDRAELEAAALLHDLTGYPVRRKLGAGRLDDTGDLDGIPETTIQVKDWADKVSAIRSGIDGAAEILEAAELARLARETLEAAEARTAVLASRSAELASLEDLASQLASRSAELAKTQAALLQADREKHAARRDRDVLLDTLSTLSTLVSAPNAQHGAPPVGPPVTQTMTTPAMKTPAVKTTAVKTPAVKTPAAWSPALLPRPATTVGAVTLSAGALPPPAPPPPPAMLPHPTMPVRSQRRRVTILPQMPDEGGHPMSEAIRRNQTQSDTILPKMLPQMLPSELPTPKLPPPSELDPRPTITPQRRRITIIS